MDEQHCSNIEDLEKFLTLWIQKLEQQMVETDRRYDERYKGQTTALQAALQSMDKRLEGMNEFRNTLRDQAGSFYTLAAHEAYAKGIEVDIRMLREAGAQDKGKSAAGTSQLLMIVMIAGLLISMAVGFMTFLTLVAHLFGIF